MTPSRPSRKSEPPLRILEAAQRFLFAHGVNGTTMDALANDLGISKKTLYVHFPSKDAILTAIVDHIANDLLESIAEKLKDPSLNCTQRLCLVADIVGGNMARLSPAILRDLQRNAPAVYERIDAMRQRNIPIIFGRIIRDGLREGSIRSDVSPDFATEFWLQAMRGLMAPDALERTGLTPRQTLERSMELYFRGLLSPSGREQFARHREQCALHRGHTG